MIMAIIVLPVGYAQLSIDATTTKDYINFLEEKSTTFPGLGDNNNWTGNNTFWGHTYFNDVVYVNETYLNVTGNVTANEYCIYDQGCISTWDISNFNNDAGYLTTESDPLAYQSCGAIDFDCGYQRIADSITMLYGTNIVLIGDDGSSYGHLEMFDDIFSIYYYNALAGGALRFSNITYDEDNITVNIGTTSPTGSERLSHFIINTNKTIIHSPNTTLHNITADDICIANNRCLSNVLKTESDPRWQSNSTLVAYENQNVTFLNVTASGLTLNTIGDNPCTGLSDGTFCRNNSGLYYQSGE